MQGLVVKLVCYLLKLPLDMEHRSTLVGAILDVNNAVRLRDVIVQSKDNTLYIDGRPVEHEYAIQLRESARGMLDNQARKFIVAQVESIAGRRGISQATKPEDLYFYRSALWWEGMQQQILQELAERQ